MYPRVKEVTVTTDYQLLIVFTNNEQKVFDVKPYLNIGVFKELKNTSIFNSVRVVDGTVQWSNDLDFCPDTLYLESSTVNKKV
jgi:hypothetical protein